MGDTQRCLACGWSGVQPRPEDHGADGGPVTGTAVKILAAVVGLLGVTAGIIAWQTSQGHRFAGDEDTTRTGQPALEGAPTCTMGSFPAACVVDEVRVFGVAGAIDAEDLTVIDGTEIVGIDAAGERWRIHRRGSDLPGLHEWLVIAQVDGILVLEGSAFTGQSFALAAMEATTGRILWQQSLAARPSSRDVVAGVIVIEHGGSIGTVRGLDIETGEELWRARVRQQIAPIRPAYQEVGSNALLCIREETGRLERVPTEDECSSGPGLQPQFDRSLDAPFLYRTVGGEPWPFPGDEFLKASDQVDVVTADHDDAAIRLRSAHDGTLRWEVRGVDLEEMSLRAVASPEFGQVFLTQDFVLLMEYTEDAQNLTALARDTGQAQWSISEQSDHDKDRAVWFQQDGDRLYRLFLDEFVALDTRSGGVIWTFPERVMHARRIDDRLILVGDKHAVWLLDPPF